MEKSARKPFVLQSLKTGLFSLIFACIGVLLLALIAKLCNIPDTVLPIVNQVLKAIAVILGVLFFVKDEKFLLKALLGGVIYWLLSAVLFSVLGGGIHWGQIGLDLVIALVGALLVAFIKSRRA